ncbi:hypothetical protein DL765_010240 [Monosporascus sp. GIB2]|nr:hypothetical protein DL765_010240 [Monosporascus sp. GIB2]
MNRLFGTGSKQPKPTLDSASANLEKRIGELDVQIQAKNIRLREHHEATKRMRGPALQRRREEALRVLASRKRLEEQRSRLEQQLEGMQNAQAMQDNLQGTMATVEAMRTANKALKKQFGKIDLDRIERVQDEMRDLQALGDEINETLSMGYEIPGGEPDEAELDEELAALGDELYGDSMLELEGGAADADKLPDFLQEDPSVNEPAATTTKVQEVAR